MEGKFASSLTNLSRELEDPRTSVTAGIGEVVRSGTRWRDEVKAASKIPPIGVHSDTVEPQIASPKTKKRSEDLFNNC